MKTEWSKEMCSEYPETFVQLNETTYLQRRNIEEDTGEGGGYVCESRRISKDVYEVLQEEYSTPTYAAVLAQQEALDAANAMLMLSQANIEAAQAGQEETLSLILENTLT